MDKLNAFIDKVAVQIVNPLLLLIAAAAFVVFLWGIFQYVIRGEGDRLQGKQAILWGLIGLVIIFGVYGILNIVTSTAGLPPIQQTIKSGSLK